MTMSHDVRSSLSPRYFQPRVRFGSTFSCAGLDAAGSIADAQLSDERKQQFDRGVSLIAQSAREPCAPQLHGVLKAQMARMHGRLHRGLRHQQTNQVISEEVHPDFFFV